MRKYRKEDRGADYLVGVQKLDGLLEQMERSVEVIREVSHACLFRLQEHHPEWQVRVIPKRDGYQLCMRDTKEILGEDGKELQYARISDALHARQKMEAKLQDKKKDAPLEVQKRRSPCRKPNR